MSVAELTLALELGFIYSLIAMGIYLTFRVIDFPDLTCDGSFVLGAATSSVLSTAGWHPALGLLIALGAGGLAGLATGLFFTRFRVPDLLSGILVAFMLYSLNLKVMGGLPNITVLPEATLFGDQSPLGLLCLLVVLVYLLVGYLLSSDFGLALRSLGQNRLLATVFGVRTPALLMIGLMLSNGLIALGGALFSQHQGFADIGSGIGTVIVGLASVMIGERLVPGRSPWFGLMSCVVGAVSYRILMSLALRSDALGLSTQDLNLMTGLLILGILALPRRRPC